MHPKTAILLSTYNGEKYLPRQLESLIGQSYKNLIVVCRDDCSSDNSNGILQAYQTKHPALFHPIEAGSRNVGACRSYALLMDYVLDHKAELGLEKAYMMFCDQDDVWSEDKVEMEMQRMEAIESDKPDIPVLIHSDLEVVSENGASIADSLMRYQGLSTRWNTFGQLLFCNIVTGCTALINEPLARRALPIPPAAVMHDWWLALVASAFGKISFIDRQLVQYRQHETNALGAIEQSSNRSIANLAGKIGRMKPNQELSKPADQADAFLERYRNDLSMGQKTRLRLTSVLRTRSGVAQRIFRRLGRSL